MITLPLTARNRPTFRILTMPQGTWDSQTWSPLPMPLIVDRTSNTTMPGTVAQGGYEVASISRWCLPDEDRAEFYVDFGRINGEPVTAEDLSGKVVRIQVLDDETFPNGVSTIPTDKWKTVFVGSVICQTEKADISTRSAGRVTYFCAGVLSRTRMWPLDRHSTARVEHAKGNPGYNVPLHGYFRKVLGNKGAGIAADPYGDLTGPPNLTSYYVEHSLPLDGSGAPDLKFTDEEVVRHALVSSRSAGEALIATDLSSGLFANTYSWPVAPGETCWDMLRRVCNRQRGRGSVFMEFEDTGTLGVDVLLTLRSRRSNIAPITYYQVTSPGSLTTTAATIPAAETGVDAVNVDINGDHRVTDAGLQVENRVASLFDAVVVQGEPIQVLCNLNFFGTSLSPRWTTADATAFNAIPVEQIRQRTSARWRHVYRRYGFPSNYSFTVTPEPGGSASSINYRTSPTGDIEIGSMGTDKGLTSEISFKFLSDLPVYEGWRYDTAIPERFDGGADYLPPARMPPVVLYRADTAAAGAKITWVPLQLAGFNVQTDEFGIYIVNSIEDANGFRMLAPSTSPAYKNFAAAYEIPDVTLASGLDQNKLNLIAAVELGTRVAFQYSNQPSGSDIYENLGRRMVLTVNGVHLWLGAPGTVWEMDYLQAATVNKWQAGLKIPSSEIAGVLRDDRDVLSLIAGLTWEYYGRLHNPGTWTLRDCGLMTGFNDIDNYRIYYPQLGQIVGKVTYAGPQDNQADATLNTPITSIHYDNIRGETTWRTDYISYDGNNQ